MEEGKTSLPLEMDLGCLLFEHHLAREQEIRHLKIEPVITEFWWREVQQKYVIFQTMISFHST